jgi:hypothetical protein
VAGQVLPWSTTIVSGSTPPGSPSTIPSGNPAYGPSGEPAAQPQVCGVTVWNNTDATSGERAAIGRSRSPVMHRSYRSIATVSSVFTHRSVTGSIANTSSR